MKQQGIEPKVLEILDEPEQPVEGLEKEPKVSTYEVTKTMLDDGLSAEEIAKERGLKISTIYSHIERFVEQDLYDASQFLDEEKYNEIRDYFESTGDPVLTPAKEVLGDDYDYNEIRLVLAELKRDGFFDPMKERPI